MMRLQASIMNVILNPTPIIKPRRGLNVADSPPIIPLISNLAASERL